MMTMIQLDRLDSEMEKIEKIDSKSFARYFKCDQCEKEFTTRKELVQHICMHRRKKQEE